MIRKPTIEIRSLMTGYHSRHGSSIVSENITETLFSGELTCLLGPNGSGKSTVLKTLCGFIPPLDGDIMVQGRSISSYSSQELAGIIGVVLTDKLTLNNMCVEDLVALGRSPYTGFWGRLSSYDKRIVDEAISLVRIEDLRERMIHTLSDGERQKVMIAKALAQETPIIFLDEPTAFLDYPSKVEILQLLQKLSRFNQKTVFLSTHDLELALQIADKIWLIDKKYGVKTGTPEDLALSGDLGKYFEREDMYFDSSSGMFKISTPATEKIRIIGSGVRKKMIVRSFARNGIGVDDSLDNEYVVIIKDNGYLFQGKLASTVGELSDIVTQFFKYN